MPTEESTAHAALVYFAYIRHDAHYYCRLNAVSESQELLFYALLLLLCIRPSRSPHGWPAAKLACGEDYFITSPVAYAFMSPLTSLIRQCSATDARQVPVSQKYHLDALIARTLPPEHTMAKRVLAGHGIATPHRLIDASYQSPPPLAGRHARAACCSR